MRVLYLQVVIASGKGGTGKTTVALGLALSLVNQPVTLVDCDVEAPNDNVFLKLRSTATIDVIIQVPQVDQDLCTHCGLCAQHCQFNAIAALPNKTVVFPDLCKGCGLCAKVCEPKAITEVPHKVGIINKARANSLTFYEGELDVGKPTAAPIIEKLRHMVEIKQGEVSEVIIDAPPGSGCNVLSAAKGVDFGILVTEPTPFGLHDLEVASKVFEALGIPYGVVVNKADGEDGEEAINQFAASRGVPVMLRIPFDRAIAEGYARGVTLPEMDEQWGDQFRLLWNQVKEAVK